MQDKAPPRCAFGASPPGGRRQRPGEAGSAATAGFDLSHATKVAPCAMER